MGRFFGRVGQDLRHLRNIDAYAFSLIVFICAVLSIAGDILPDGARWAVLLASVGLLLFRMTLPDRWNRSADDFLKDRTAFDEMPFPARLRSAREVWIFAPSAVNLLAPQHCDTLRTTVLANSDGVVKVVVLDPAATTAVEVAALQLDDPLDYPRQIFRSSLESTMRQLERMTSWDERGSFEYRVLNYSPGFSLVAIDPGTRQGIVIVEFHGFHNEVTNTRMHITLDKAASEHWYMYWIGQFDRIWLAAQPPGEGIGHNVD